jgi:hypothetical protein
MSVEKLIGAVSRMPEDSGVQVMRTVDSLTVGLTNFAFSDLRDLAAAYGAQQRVISLAHDVVMALGGSSEILSILNSPHLGYDEMEKALRGRVAEAKEPYIIEGEVDLGYAECIFLDKIKLDKWMHEKELDGARVRVTVSETGGE